MIVEPPPIRNLEIVEVDVYNETITLRWEAPMPPNHGLLDSYSIVSCSNESDCDDETIIFVESDEFCNLWELDVELMMSERYLCQTVSFPKDRNYSVVKVCIRGFLFVIQ